jgi:disulfide bond formation protein DsbB
MTPEIVMFAIAALLIGACALLAARIGPWHLMIVGSSIAVLGTMLGYEVSMFSSSTAGAAPPIKLGQGLMAFASVVGGAIVGTAFTELRARWRKA